VFASYWLLILQQDSWRGANRACVVRADDVVADPVASAHLLVSCIHDVVVRQYLTILAGPRALAGLTVASLVVIPRLILIWLQTTGLRANDASTRDQLHATSAFIGHEVLVLTRVGNNKLIIISLLQEDPPDTAPVLALARAAAAKAAT
jgi:hypothetical protein